MRESVKTTSGQATDLSQQLNRDEVVANVRRLSGTPADRGLDDDHIVAGVTGFTEQLEYWYVRVMREAVPNYRRLVVARINPFVRRVEFDGMAAAGVAGRLVDDYDARNFVTAGGWAIERMAVEASPTGHKSSASGIDIERHDAGTGITHLYVVKSGTVTRNSDILKALKRNAREAEGRLLQGRGKGKGVVAVRANYAIAAGQTTTSWRDGIARPSSGEFWAEVLGLSENDAIETALAMAAEAGRIVKRDASSHVGAMKVLVEDYVSKPGSPGEVDWEFISRRNMRTAAVWQGEDLDRHKHALAALRATGYALGRTAEKAPATGPITETEVAAAEAAARLLLAGDQEEAP